MRKTFGDVSRWQLRDTAVPILRAMAAVYGCEDNPYEKLASIIEKHDEVELWAEY